MTSLGSPGADNSVVKAFEAIIADPDARPSLRCEVAQFLGQLKYPPSAKLDFQSLAGDLGYQSVEICKHEIDAAKVAKRVPSRKLLVHAAYSSMVGLEGSDAKSGLWAAAAGTDNQQAIDGVRSKLKSLLASIEDKDEVPDDTLASVAGGKLSELESALPPRKAGKSGKETVAKEDAAEPAKKPEAPRAAVEDDKVGAQ